MEKNISVDNKEKNKKRGILILILILILSILLGTGIWFYRRNNSSNNGASSGIVSWNNVSASSFDDYLQKMQQRADDSLFRVEINSTPLMKSGDSDVRLLIQNHPDNKFNMQVVITLNSTKEVIYTSSVIKPNQHIENAKLNKKLDKGKHNAVATFKAIDPSNNNVVQNVNIDIVFTVES